MASCVGIDYSTRKLSVAVVTEPGPTRVMAIHRHQAHRKEVGIDAIKSVLASFKDWAADGWLVDTPVVIESPIVGGNRNMQTAIGMAMTAGALMAVCYHYGAAAVDFVAPATWKKEVCGHGNYDKEEVMRWLSEYHPRMYRYVANDDDADAVCIALYGAMTESEVDDG